MGNVAAELGMLSNYQLDSMSNYGVFSTIDILLSFNGSDITKITLKNVIHSVFSRDVDTEEDCLYVGEVSLRRLESDKKSVLASLKYSFVEQDGDTPGFPDEQLYLFHLEGAVVMDVICQDASVFKMDDSRQA